MPVVLTVIQGPSYGQQIVVSVEQSPRTVGRSHNADACIGDEWLNDTHFAVYFDGARAVLRDLGSTHGTFVNSVGTTECALVSGDQVAAGQTFFSVELSADVAAAPPPSDALTPEELYEAMRHEPRDRLRWALREEEHALYAVVDLAVDASLIVKINRSGEEFCALDEMADPQDPGAIAPLLVLLSDESDLLADLIEDAWARGALVFLTSDQPFQEVYAHLVGITEYDPSGSIRAATYHKPDALYEHLARCSSDEVDDFFGPVRTFLAESENPDELLRFQRSDNGVSVESIPLA